MSFRNDVAVDIDDITGSDNSAITKFWNDIKDWLNNTAADVVQEYIGYDATKAMQKAVIIAERRDDDICVIAHVYYQSDPQATHYDKVTMEVTAPTDEFDDELIKTINEQRILTQEIQYKM